MDANLLVFQIGTQKKEFLVSAYSNSFFRNVSSDILKFKTSQTMKTKVDRLFMLLVAVPGTAASNSPLSYLIGAIIAVLIMGYLVYTLLHPEKF